MQKWYSKYMKQRGNIIILLIVIAAIFVLVILNSAFRDQITLIKNTLFKSPAPTSLPSINSPTPKIPSTEASAYVCPDTAWVDCMPIIEGPKKSQCEPTYLTWAKQNCPNFQGAAY